jgi:hypothetical protein
MRALQSGGLAVGQGSVVEESGIRPDAPNRLAFASARLRTDETCRQITRIRLTPLKAEPERPAGHERGGEKAPRGG